MNGWEGEYDYEDCQIFCILIHGGLPFELATLPFADLVTGYLDD